MYKWECKDLSIAIEFLCICIQYQGYKILVNWYTYLDKVIKKFRLQNIYFTPTPLPQGYYLLKHNGPINPEL